MYDDNATVNKLNLVFNYFYLAIVFLLYFSAFIYGKVEAWFFIGLFLIALISYGASLIVYFKNKEDSKLKLRITSAFILLYLYIMILGHTEFRFALVFPPLCLLVMYHNTKFVVKVSAAIIAVNLLNVFVCIFVFKRVSYDYTSRYTIQMISIVLACICIYCAARAYSFSFNRIKMQHLQLEQMSLQTIETIANTIDAKDPYTQGHSRRVAEYSEYIAQKLGYSDEEVEKIKYIALLHDVGKIAVPDPVLNKPSKLTDTEYEIMKTHTVAGGDILKDIQTIPDIALGAMYHHERFDGKGYPEGLAGEDIPMIGRIIGLADAYDAMTSNRIYRRRLSRQAVIDEIKRCRGTQFDPECVDAFMDYVEEFTMDDNFREKNINTLRDIGVSAAVPSSALEPNEDYEVDRLTGFYNRELGERSLDEMLKHQTGAIILINMVGLRLINMEYGFRRGDYYLKIVGGALLASGEELLPIRFDGNEFVCFMPGVTDKNVISKWMDNLLGRIQALGKTDSLVETNLGVVGAITIHDDTSTKMSVHIRALDKALGELRKQQDKPYVFYDSITKHSNTISRDEDIHDLVKIYERRHDHEHPDIMGENDFTKLVSNINADDSKDVTLMLFTVKPVKGNDMPVQKRQQAMSILEESIVVALKGNANISHYSSLQLALVLVNSADNSDDWKKYIVSIEKEVLSTFYKNYDRFDTEIKSAYKIIPKNK